MNRAFSAGVFFEFTNSGALPQASRETAPLALTPVPCRVAAVTRTILSAPRTCRQDCLHHVLLAQRLIEILDQIVGVFEADGQAQQPFG